MCVHNFFTPVHTHFFRRKLSYHHPIRERNQSTGHKHEPRCKHNQFSSFVYLSTWLRGSIDLIVAAENGGEARMG